MYNPYAVMYDARMDVYRWQDEETDGITKPKQAPVSKGRPCRYSSSGQVSTGAPAPSIVNSHKGNISVYKKNDMIGFRAELK